MKKSTIKNITVLAITAGTVAFSGWMIWKRYKEFKAREAIELEVAEETKADKEVKNKEKEAEIRQKRREIFVKDMNLMEKEEEKAIIKALEDDECTEDDSKALFDEEMDDYLQEDEEELYIHEDRSWELVDMNRSKMSQEEIEEAEEIYIREIDHEHDMWCPIEEEEELLYEPNSIEALNQYKNMKLAEIRDIETRDIYLRLFEIEFIPMLGDDIMLRDRLMSVREEFFGPHSTWNNHITIADLFLYFIELSKFDLDGDTESYARLFIMNCGMKHDMSLTGLGNVVGNMVSHCLITETGFGLFGLDDIQVGLIRSKNLDTLGDPTPTFNSQYFAFVEEGLY